MKIIKRRLIILLKECLENVRKNSPLIHNITNYVTVNDCEYANPDFDPIPSIPTESFDPRFVDAPYCV
jgi:hypothetical protein